MQVFLDEAIAVLGPLLDHVERPDAVLYDIGGFAGRVLDGILGNTDPPILEHATDTHGAGLANFALFDLVGKQLSPPLPVPRSRMRRASRGTWSSRTLSPSARRGYSSARPSAGRHATSGTNGDAERPAPDSYRHPRRSAVGGWSRAGNSHLFRQHLIRTEAIHRFDVGTVAQGGTRRPGSHRDDQLKQPAWRSRSHPARPLSQHVSLGRTDRVGRLCRSDSRQIGFESLWSLRARARGWHGERCLPVRSTNPWTAALWCRQTAGLACGQQLAAGDQALQGRGDLLSGRRQHTCTGWRDSTRRPGRRR